MIHQSGMIHYKSEDKSMGKIWNDKLRSAYG